MPMTVPAGVGQYVGEVTAAIRRVRADVVGVYLHGSAVLGGFRPEASDVDVLAVVDGTAPLAVQRATGEAAAAVGGCPGVGLEMSVITGGTAATLGGCPFEVHVNTSGTQPVIVTGAGRAGDGDLVLHCAVCRAHALPVYGPPADQVFGPVPRRRVLDAMLDELRWALDRAPTTYTVLNACRALRFAEDGRLASKIDGGEWYLARHGPAPVVEAALDDQRHGRSTPPAADTATLVAGVRARLRAALDRN